MKKKYFLLATMLFTCCFVPLAMQSQVPVANFSVSANPACTNNNNAVQITDLSSNSPSAWSYTVAIAGFGPGGVTVLTSQNPTAVFIFPGTYTITLVATNANGTSAAFSQTVLVLRSPDVNINPANVNSCLGGSAVSINLNPSGPGNALFTYSWSTGATSTSISVSPAVTTTYSCIITATNGCTTLRASTVNIGQPTVIINSFPVNICPGSNATLTGQISGQGPYSFLWSSGQTSNSITTATAGTYSVTITNGQSCSSTQTYVLGTSATLSLTASTTPTAICSGNNGVLHVSGAGTYTWSNGATTANVMVNPMVTTNYSVTGSFGACTGTTSVLLTVSMIPTITLISSTNAVCSGNSVSISATGATSYTWNPGLTVASSVTVSPGSTTTFTVRGQNPGCPARNASITITVLQNPTVNVTSTSPVACVGEAVALAANGANSYLWSNGAQSNVILVTPSITTVFTVTGVALNSCTASANITQVISECTGILEQSWDALKIFPNPGNGFFYVTSTEAMEVRIVNEQGAVVRQLVLNGENGYSLCIADLSEGLYVVTGIGNKSIVARRLVIAR
ncbi:MAG: T9SS type A sorting domain-containing protein [Bacteroidota bacterium]